MHSRRHIAAVILQNEKNRNKQQTVLLRHKAGDPGREINSIVSEMFNALNMPGEYPHTGLY